MEQKTFKMFGFAYVAP